MSLNCADRRDGLIITASRVQKSILGLPRLITDENNDISNVGDARF